MNATDGCDVAKSADSLLPDHARRRYFTKLLDIDGVDPYEVPKKSWSANPDDLPDVSYFSIVNYFVFGKSAYTSDDFRAYKSLNSYKVFVAGWVRDVLSFRPDGCQNVVVTAKVLHSQRLNEKALTPWLIASVDGIILSAHCTCMAGLGETCTHVGALAFAIDAFVTTRNKVTCTDVKAYWKIPQGVKGVTPKAAWQIDFSSAKAKKNKLEKFIDDNEDTSLHSGCLKPLFDVSRPSDKELSELVKQLSIGKSKPNILKILPEYCEQYRVHDDVSLPASLQELRQQKFVGMTLKELQLHSSSLSIKVSAQESKAIEEATRDQAKNPAWFSARAGRITASTLYAACHAKLDMPPASLIKKICYPEKMLFTSEATIWGSKNESVAKKQYAMAVTGVHANITIRPCGLHVPPEYPFMGASPDAVVSCDCHGVGCVELKCPFSQRNKTITEALSCKSFCLQETDSKLTLKENHPYYSQVQGQLFLTKSAYCDFVVWTTIDIAIIRILPNQLFWDESVEKATKFFKLAILPELIGNWTECAPSLSGKGSTKKRPLPLTDSNESCDESGDDTNDPNNLFCLCRQGEHGRMIACDSKSCTVEWFHFACVGLKTKPRGSWYCPNCALEPGSNVKKQKN